MPSIIVLLISKFTSLFYLWIIFLYTSQGLPTSRWHKSGVWCYPSGLWFLQKEVSFTYRYCACHLQHRRGAVHEGALLLKSASSHRHQDLCKHTRTGLLHNVIEQPVKNTVTVTNANELVMEGICPSQRPSLRKGNSTDVSEIKFAAVLGLQIGGNTVKATVVNGRGLTMQIGLS